MPNKNAKLGRIARWCFFLALSLGVAPSPGEAREQPSEAATQTGIAVYYSDSFQGRPVANEEILDQRGLTAAHNGYALGTRVRVTNLSNGKSVVVKINDRMGPDDTLLIDVTRRAAEELDFIERRPNHGTTRGRRITI